MREIDTNNKPGGQNGRFVTGEFYHLYNRGTEKRAIFIDERDVDRFFKGLSEFNQEEAIGSLYEHSFIVNRLRQLGHPMSKLALVKVVSYAANDNHYHLLVQQTRDRGIERFMHRLNMGYSKYFNTKYQRQGSLWGGKFRSKHVDSNEYLLHLSVYINLNHLAHGLGHPMSKLTRTSWGEYLADNQATICDKSIILSQFNHPREYREFAENSLTDIIQTKLAGKESFD